MKLDKLSSVSLLENVAIGEAFVYHEKLYMKIETSEIKIGSWNMAAVRLSDGHVNLFCGSAKVNTVDAKVVYKEN